MKTFCCWSGGKDSMLSLYKMQKEGVLVKYLLNMVSEDGKYSRSHGLSADLLKKQAECIDIPLIQTRSTWQDYEKEFKKAISDMDGIEAGIFGDIDLQEHRDWVERICKDLGIVPILPLWKENRERLLNQFIKAEFKTVIVATNAVLLGQEWLGRRIDKKFIKDIKALGGIDLCGEKGEYHTFVFNGPIFKKPLEITIGEKILKDNHWFLELKIVEKPLQQSLRGAPSSEGQRSTIVLLR